MAARRQSQKKKAAPAESTSANPRGGSIEFGMPREQLDDLVSGARRERRNQGKRAEAEERPWLGWVLRMGGTALRERDRHLGDGVVARTWRLPDGREYEAEVWEPDQGSEHRLVQTRRVES